MSQSRYRKWDLLEIKERLEQCSRVQKLAAQVKAGAFMDVLTLG
jgi:hypothetical protein